MDDATASGRMPQVVMLCGIAGSGKSTYAMRMEARGFERLSIDREIWETFGRYGIDYPAADYAAHSDAAEARLRERLRRCLRDGRDGVLDLSFWRRASRDDYRALVARDGGRLSLVYLRASREVLRRRLAERALRFDADAAFAVTEAQLDAFIACFEAPSGEGETVIDQRWDAPEDPQA